MAGAVVFEAEVMIFPGQPAFQFSGAGNDGIAFNAVGSLVVIRKNPTAQNRCRGYPSPPFIQDSTSACTENGRAGLEAKRACN
jgi:hypothetical protein